MWLLGVEACKTDMDNQKVMVTGHFNLEKLLKTLKKKTGRKAEILMKNERFDIAEDEDDEHDIVQNENDEHEVVQKENNEHEIIPEKHEEGNILPTKDESLEIEEKDDKPEQR